MKTNNLVRRNSTLTLTYRNVGIESSGDAANILALGLCLVAIIYLVNKL